MFHSLLYGRDSFSESYLESKCITEIHMPVADVGY